jgi:hypothetical protein
MRLIRDQAPDGGIDDYDDYLNRYDAEPSIDSVGPSEPLPDAETLEHLRALGYVE